MKLSIVSLLVAFCLQSGAQAGSIPKEKLAKANETIRKVIEQMGVPFPLEIRIAGGKLENGKVTALKVEASVSYLDLIKAKGDVRFKLKNMEKLGFRLGGQVKVSKEFLEKEMEIKQEEVRKELRAGLVEMTEEFESSGYKTSFYDRDVLKGVWVMGAHAKAKKTTKTNYEKVGINVMGMERARTLRGHLYGLLKVGKELATQLSEFATLLVDKLAAGEMPLEELEKIFEVLEEIPEP